MTQENISFLNCIREPYIVCTVSQYLTNHFSLKALLGMYIVGFKLNLPFEFGQPRRISETFSKRIAVDFQLGYL